MVLCIIEERWKFITRGYEGLYLFFVLLQIFKIFCNFSIIMGKNIRQQKKKSTCHVMSPSFVRGVLAQWEEAWPEIPLSPTCCSFSYPISGDIMEFLPSLPSTISSHRVLNALHSIIPAALGPSFTPLAPSASIWATCTTTPLALVWTSQICPTQLVDTPKLLPVAFIV